MKAGDIVITVRAEVDEESFDRVRRELQELKKPQEPAGFLTAVAVIAAGTQAPAKVSRRKLLRFWK